MFQLINGTCLEKKVFRLGEIVKEWLELVQFNYQVRNWIQGL